MAEPLRWVERLDVVNTVIAVRPFYHGRVGASRSAVPARWSHFFSLPGGLGLPTAGAFLYAHILGQVRALHRAKPIHLIHAHAPLPCGHAAALLSHELGIPFVVTVHGLDAYSTRQVGGPAGQWCKRVTQWVYSSARQVICISEKVRAQVVEGSAPVNTEVVYNGVDPQVFAPHGERPGSDVLLSVGGLIPIKGHELLLRAFGAIQHRFPDLSCDIIGDGPERSRLSALAAELNLAGKTRFLGRRNRAQVAEAMRDCTIFALPSRYEGLGCVYLEAMSAGKPVIACRGQGIEEVILHGSNGWLVDPGDVRGLSAAISELLENAHRQRQMGEAARRTILGGFTLAHQAEGLVRVYRECAA
ncbi:MAG: glycosyltransferase [Acidobacteriia bacterium]|nr:glycosyltransferase [Terriglobia bacterium]